MKYVLYAMVVVVMACLARAAGGGLGARLLNKRGAVDDTGGYDKGGIMPVNLSMLPEILFGLAMASPWFVAGHWIAGLLAAVAAYLWMETGHGIAYHMGRLADQVDPLRKQTLSPVVDWLAARLSLTPYRRAWCWLFMGIKGLLIGMACPVFGLLLAVLWPLAYEIGWSVMERFPSFKPTRTELAEYISGAFAGLVLVLSLTFWV